MVWNPRRIGIALALAFLLSLADAGPSWAVNDIVLPTENCQLISAIPAPYTVNEKGSDVRLQFDRVAGCSRETPCTLSVVDRSNGRALVRIVITDEFPEFCPAPARRGDDNTCNRPYMWQDYTFILRRKADMFAKFIIGKNDIPVGKIDEHITFKVFYPSKKASAPNFQCDSPGTGNGPGLVIESGVFNTRKRTHIWWFAFLSERRDGKHTNIEEIIKFK